MELTFDEILDSMRCGSLKDYLSSGKLDQKTLDRINWIEVILSANDFSMGYSTIELRMYYIERKTEREIAAALFQSESTISYRLKKYRESLKTDILKHEYLLNSPPIAQIKKE